MIELGDRGITREEYDGIVAGELVSLDPDALARLQDTRAKMLAHIATGVPAYGVTRGLGHLAGVAVSTDDQAQLQASLLTARAAGFGERLPAGVVRGAMLVRLTGFLHGPSGVTPTLCQRDRRPTQRRLDAGRPGRALRCRRRNRASRPSLPDDHG